MCEICSKLTVKVPEKRQWCHFGVFIVNFEHISHLVLVYLLLTFEKVNASWVVTFWNIDHYIIDIDSMLKVYLYFSNHLFS